MSNQEQFIGRSEREVKKLITNPFGIVSIRSQVPLDRLIPNKEFQFFDEEIQKHKFDFVAYRKNDIIAIEVNYQHGTKADFKSNNIFKKCLEQNGVRLLTIDDHSCRTLFKQNSKGIHHTTTDDVRDLLDAFDIAKISIN